MFAFALLRAWILGLVSLALLGGAGWLLYEWYDNQSDREYLYWAIGLLSVVFLGRWLMFPLVGLGGIGEPRLVREGTSQRLAGDGGPELYVEFHGHREAPPLVLVHGWSFDSRGWYYARRELGDRFRLITWDLRGAGLSQEPADNDFSIERMAEDLDRVIKLAGRPVTLVGHSMGGMIIQKYCELFPQQLATTVERIVLVGTTYTNPLRHTQGRGLALALQKPLIEPLLRLTIAASPLVKLMNWMSYQNGSMHLTTRLGSFGGSQTWKEVDFAARIGVEQSPAVMARMALAMLEFDAREADARLKLPTLLLHGRNDRTIQVDAGEELKGLISNSELQALEQTGHQLILERHEDFAREAAKFASTRKPAVA